MQNHDFNVNTHKENNKMEYLTDIDEFQAALKMVNVNEDMNVTKSNNVLLEGVELDCYHKCQKILDTPEMKKCHKRCLDVNFDELNESDIDTINELYDLGIERGLIDPDTEAEPEDKAVGDQMVDPNVQEPLKDVGDGCEMDDVDGDAYWDMKKALRECGEYGSIDKSIEEEIMDEEYPMGDDEGEIPSDEQIPEDDQMERYKALQKKSYDKIEKQFDKVIDFGATQYIRNNNGSDELYDKIIDYLNKNKDEVIDAIYRGAEGIDRFDDMEDYLANELIPEMVDTDGNIIDIYSTNESEDPSMSEDPQSDEMTPPDGYDEDELIAALDDKDVAPSDSDIEKMSKDNTPVDDKDMPFEAEGDDVEADTEEAPVADDSSDEGAGDEVQDTSTDDTEAVSDDGGDEVEDDTATEPEEDSTDDTETADTTDTETPADDTTADTDDSSEDTSTEDSDTEEVKDDTEEEEDDTSDDETEDAKDDEKDEDSTEDDTEEDKPEEKDLTADDKAQLKNEYTNMFSDIVKGMLSEVEPEEGKKVELCVKDMTPEQKSEFWNKVAEQWEGKADPADFMSASELESLEKQVEKKEKEESSKED